MKTTALVIIDMQNDFVKGPLATPEAAAVLPRIASFLPEFMRYSPNVFFTRDTHGIDYLATMEGKYLPVPHCIEGTAGWHVCPELLDAHKLFAHGTDPIFINKPTFGSTRLMYALAALENRYGLEEIILCGVCTDICVVSNALHLKTWFPNTEITVDASLCAGTTPENHRAALRVMQQCQINVTGLDKEVQA